ncbi:MAG: hypothetical protein ACI8ZB_000526 [Desulforhopalus sp.]|jgi:hypothetical protein
METYIPPKPFVDNPRFQTDRQTVLNNLDITLVDEPLIYLINDLNNVPYLFTLQCCYGHFLTTESREILDLDLLGTSDPVEYRLAYIAFCIENSPPGRQITQQLKNIPLSVGPSLVQFCSAQWFWDQWVNSYALQIMPQRFKDKDSTIIDCYEARKIKEVRDIFFMCMKDLASTILEQANVR